MISRRMINKQISATLILSFIAMGINYLIVFTLTSYITSHLGTEAYGFVTLAKTISNYGIIVTSCLNSFASRFITIAFHQNDLKKANIYYSSVVLANILLAVFVIILGIGFICKIESFINIPGELVHDVKILLFIDIVNYMVLNIGGIFSTYAYIKNQLARLNFVQIVSYAMEAVILLILFMNFAPKVYYVGIALIISAVFLACANYIFLKVYTPELKIAIANFSWIAVKDLVLNGIWNSINNVGNLLNSGLDLWVSNLLLSSVAMGELSIVKTVSTLSTTIAQLISKPFHPQLLKAYSDKNIGEVTKILNKQIRFTGYFVCVVFAGFISIGSSYFSLWTPNQNISLLSGIAVVTVIGFLFEGMATPLFYTYTLTLKNRIPCIVTIISGLLNVFGMYMLLTTTNIELYGVVGTTTVLGFGTYFIFTPIYAAHCLGVRWNTFYPSMIRDLISDGIVCVIVIMIPFENLANNWIGFILSALIICLIAMPIHVLCTIKFRDIVRFLRR